MSLRSLLIVVDFAIPNPTAITDGIGLLSDLRGVSGVGQDDGVNQSWGYRWGLTFVRLAFARRYIFFIIAGDYRT